MSIVERLIESELSWRERELALAKVELSRAIREETRFQFFYRAFVSASHAHFEGFIKAIVEQTLIDIIRHARTARACNTSIIQHLFCDAARKYVQNLNFEQIISEVLLGNHILDRLQFPKPEIAYDVSNMNFDNFSWCMGAIGLKGEAFQTYKFDLNHLTSLRHTCAHGEKITFNRNKTNSEIAEDVFKLQHSISLLTHEVALSVIDLVDNKKFLSTSYAREVIDTCWEFAVPA